MFKFGLSTSCAYLGDIRIKRTYLGTQLLYPCGHCCRDNTCDYTILTKQDCEECVYPDPECFVQLMADENGNCPSGFVQQYGMCTQTVAVADCNECAALEAQYNAEYNGTAFAYCSIGPPTGACGTWLEGTACTNPGKCTGRVCVTGLPSLYYGGTFRLGEYAGLPDPWDGYRGPHDSMGTFNIMPSCGAWIMNSDKWDWGGSYYIREYLGSGCLGDITNVPVRIYKNALPPATNSVLWQTVNVSFTPGDCPA